VGARLVYAQPVMTRIISFEYLNRQLVWQEVSEVLLFVLPLLDVARARGALARLLPRLPDPRRLLARLGVTTVGINSVTGGAAASESVGGELVAKGAGGQAKGRDGTAVESGVAGPSRRPQGPCPVCGSEDMLIPVVAQPCGHCFCYVCLAGSAAADSAYACPCDGVRVTAMKRWHPHGVVLAAR
jgi:peroxin-2